MDTNDYEVIIINTPLPDEFGHELGTDAVQKTDAGVILLAKTGTAEQIADKLQDFGVLVLGKPFTRGGCSPAPPATPCAGWSRAWVRSFYSVCTWASA